MLYSPLNAAQREIRLLHLSPGTEYEELKCTFSLASLNDEPEYEALSYVWGDVDDKLPIRTEAGTAYITRNLHSALKNLRFIDRIRVLWADALCINQQDLAELSSQVSMMASVFNKAFCVVVYLGDAWDGCELAMEAIRQLATNKHLHLSSTKSPGLNVNGVGLECKKMRSYFFKFFNSSWATRVWTVQEYVLAKRTMVQYGQLAMPGELMKRAYQACSPHANACCAGLTLTSPEYARTFRNFRSLWVLQDQDNPADEVIWVLEQVRDRNSTDPRDKIYGMLGLVKETLSGVLNPDYTMTAEEVFQAMAVACIKLTGRLDFLSACYEDEHLYLPSWVPDWSVYNRSLRDRRARVLQIFKYKACGDRIANTEVLPGGKLVVAGVIVDVVMAYTGMMGVKMGDSNFEEEAQKIADIDWTGNRTYCGSQRTSEIEAYYVSLFGGIVPDEEDVMIMRRAHHVGENQGTHWYNKWKSSDDPKTRFKLNELHRFMVNGRCFLKTKKGYLGLAPSGCQQGDVVVVLNGGLTPYVLRRLPGGKSEYTFLGDAYMHGIMDGEAFEGVEETNALERFVLV